MLKGRTDNDPIRCCASCFSKVMERGSDTVGWQGIQLTDDPAILSWYCPRPVCQQTLHIAFRARVRELRIAQGLSPEPEGNVTPAKTNRSPLAGRAEGAGSTLGIPPGGFAASEPAPVVIEEEG